MHCNATLVTTDQLARFLPPAILGDERLGEIAPDGNHIVIATPSDQPFGGVQAFIQTTKGLPLTTWLDIGADDWQALIEENEASEDEVNTAMDAIRSC